MTQTFNNVKNTFNIRECLMTDLEGIVLLNKLAFCENENYDTNIVHNWDGTNYFEKCIQSAIEMQNHFFFVLTNDRGIVGYVNGYIEKSEYMKEPRCEVENIGIHPEFQNQGGMNILMEEVTKFMKKNNVTLMSVEIFAKNQRMKNILENKGFEQVDIVYRKRIV